MRPFLFLGRIGILTSLALICWRPALSTQAAVHVPGPSIPEFTGAQPASAHHALTTVVDPARATWVDDIANALGPYFKAHYPTSDFTSYLKKLTLVRGAEELGDRRRVEVEMGAFFTMLTNRSQGISAGAADEVANFARAMMPVQEYGIFFPTGPAQYGTPASRSESEQELAMHVWRDIGPSALSGTLSRRVGRRSSRDTPCFEIRAWGSRVPRSVQQVRPE